MKNASLRLVLVCAVVAALWAVALLSPPRTIAYQILLNKAKKFGAKDCLFCHTPDDGGEGWNGRGRWLMEQKARRAAEKVDAEWLVDYKPDASPKPAQDQSPDPVRPLTSWGRFRGPNGTGVSNDRNVPVVWSEGDGVLWS